MNIIMLMHQVIDRYYHASALQVINRIREAAAFLFVSSAATTTTTSILSLSEKAEEDVPATAECFLI